MICTMKMWILSTSRIESVCVCVCVCVQQLVCIDVTFITSSNMITPLCVVAILAHSL